MGRNNDDEMKAFLVIFAIAVCIVVLYFLLKLAVVIGLVGFVCCAILLIWGLRENDSTFLTIGGIGILASLLLFFVGLAGTHFFEQTETGQTLLNGSNTVIDSGVTAYATVADMKVSEAETHKEIGSILGDVK
jgi:dolichyl-phosphate-mannose--protein O-mannosyl transferase